MISIIVPAYNSAKYLIDCLDSIANQDFDDYEVLVVNDGSTDNTGEIAKQYCDNHNKFKYFYKENGGLMSSYLFALDYASGDYIGFVDSDDIIEKNMFSTLYSLSKEKKADIVMCDYDHFPNERDEAKAIIQPGLYNGLSMENILNNIFPPFSGNHISNSRINKIFKTQLVFSIGKYLQHKSRYFEDRFFTVAAVFYANSFYYLNKTLYHVRINEIGKSNSSRTAEKLYDAIKTLASVQKEILNDTGLFDHYKTKYDLACLNHLSLFIDRNIIYPTAPLKIKKNYAKQIIKDNFYKKLVKAYKKELIGKKGFLIKMSYFFNSPLLMATLSCLKKK